MKTKKIILSLLLLLVGSFSYSQIGADVPHGNCHNLYIYVLDNNENPVYDADVTVNNVCVGLCSVCNYYAVTVVPNNFYTVTATKMGYYVTKVTDVEVTDDGATLVIIHIYPQ